MKHVSRSTVLEFLRPLDFSLKIDFNQRIGSLIAIITILKRHKYTYSCDEEYFFQEIGP